MRLDLFSKNDTVLLLGEGNFSFSVSLHKHKLPIKIIATCLESNVEFEHQRENLDYLKSNKVPVYLNVDATKLRDNENFANVKFSKIVFNFPHVGGKMKIHLNRELLRKTFENCGALLAEDGLMIMSLCRGQGGTPADQPQRRWHDSWQVTEMAAHGDFVLTAVEPFHIENFTEYRCIGYRSQDTQFHLHGALVHVFAKRKPPFESLNLSTAVSRLSLVPLSPGSEVLVPTIYSEIYRNNPITNMHSPISFVKEFLLKSLTETSVNSEWKVLYDDKMPFHVENETGVSCRVNNAECALRATPFDILSDLLQTLVEMEPPLKNVLFLGTYFSPLADFSYSPIRIDFTIIGKNLLSRMTSFLKGLIALFETRDVVLSQKYTKNDIEEKCGYSVTSFTELVVADEDTSGRVTAAICYGLQYKGISTEICIVYAQAICQKFFVIGWREIWTYKTAVVHLPKPILKLSSLYPGEYKFDITLRYTEPYPERRLWELLWLAAGELIHHVELISKYSSGEGWCSKCYRLTYKSLDKPLFKERVLEIHSNIVGKVLELGLNVTIG